MREERVVFGGGFGSFWLREFLGREVDRVNYDIIMVERVVIW